MAQRYVLPVIHHLDFDTSVEQANIAFKHGAHGVFLISHNGQDESLFAPAVEIKRSHPDRLIGLNLLGSSAAHALLNTEGSGLDMVWVDAPGVTSKGVNDEAAQIGRLLKRAHQEDKKPLFFGSVAFKYQPHEPAPGQAAFSAFQLGMVPTTSGSGTGSAPDLDKIMTMRDAIGPDAPFAIASGMTPENVGEFLPYLTHFLVATGISKDVYHFDEPRLMLFVQRVLAG